MGSIDVGSGPGVKSVGTDTGRGKRTAPSNPASGPGTPGADGGVKQSGGAGGNPSQAQAPATRRSDSGAPSTGSGDPSSGPGTQGGVQSKPHSGSGRGAPAAAAPPASARRLSSGPAASLPAVVNRPLPTGSTNFQEQANRAGLRFTNDQ